MFVNSNYEHLAIDNIKLMHYLLNKYKFEFNDTDWFNEFKESFMPSYIICCQRFDPSKGFKFSAYLSQTIYHHFCMWKTRKQNKHFIQSNILSLDDKITDNENYIEQVIEDKRLDVNSEVLINCIIKLVKDNYISNDEIQIFELTMSGYTQFEISNLLHCSQVHVSRKLKRIRKIIKCELLK